MNKILKISLWTLLLIGFCVILGFTINLNQDRTCEDININFSADCPYPLMTETMVEEMLSDNGIRVRGIRVRDLSVDQIENTIAKGPHVSHAKVYNDLSGELNIYISQRIPMARVYNASNHSFYIDHEGKPMDLSENYAARVLGVSADFNLPESYGSENQRMSDIYDQIISTLNFIVENDFWKSQITHLHVTGNGEIELTPRVGNHKILLGKATDLEIKFDNLWEFYRSCEEHQAWNKYKTLNLKYRDQIVCTKK